MADRTLNWVQKHTNTGVVKTNVTKTYENGDKHNDDVDCVSPGVLAAAAALEAAVCTELGATIVEPPKPAEEAKAE